MSEPIYKEHSEHLSQGDIFFSPIFGLTGSSNPNFARLPDGQIIPHPIEENCQIKTFTVNQLHIPLALNEFVRTSVRTLPRFVLASQTCDVCGIDRPIIDECIVAPLVTVADLCRVQLLPIGPNEEDITIVNFLKTKSSMEQKNIIDQNLADDFKLPDTVRKMLIEIQFTSAKDKENKGRLVKFLNKYVTGKMSAHIYYLTKNDEFEIPESYIDLNSLFLFKTAELKSLENSRLCTLASPCREHFSSQLGNRFSRIALKDPIAGVSFR